MKKKGPRPRPGCSEANVRSSWRSEGAAAQSGRQLEFECRKCFIKSIKRPSEALFLRMHGFIVLAVLKKSMQISSHTASQGQRGFNFTL